MNKFFKLEHTRISNPGDGFQNTSPAVWSQFFTKIWTCRLSGMSTCTTVWLILLQHTEIKISKQVSNFLKRIRWEFLKIGCANIRPPGILFFSWFFENFYRLQWGMDTHRLKVLLFSALLQSFVLSHVFIFSTLYSPESF